MSLTYTGIDKHEGEVIGLFDPARAGRCNSTLDFCSVGHYNFAHYFGDRSE